MNTRSGSFFGVGLGAETKRINMKVQMNLEKRNDGLSVRNLEAALAAQDKDGSGSLDFIGTENGLKAYRQVLIFITVVSIFLPVTEIQGLMKNFNAGTDSKRLFKYAEWVESLRLPLEGRRLDIVQKAFSKVAGEGSVMSVAQAKENFGFEGFDQWCSMIGADAADEAATVDSDSFGKFYGDISMAVFEDAKFVKLVEDTWGVSEPGVSKVDPKDVEELIKAMRLNLMKYGNKNHTEEFVLRELFRQFDRDNNGSLSIVELKGMLGMINIQAADPFMEALIKILDKNGNGAIEFEEFVAFMVQDRYTKA